MAKNDKAASAKTADKVAIKFNGEPHHKLVVEGQEIWGGKTGSVSASVAEELLAAPWANVTLADTKTPHWPHNLDKLAKIADKHGVELPIVPVDGGVPEPTASDYVAALEAAGVTPATA